MPLYFILSLALLAQEAPAATPGSGLALLNSVVQRYAQAKSYHIEAVKEQTFTEDLSRTWEKVYMTAIVAPGEKYRYEARSRSGSAMQLSDGTFDWEYLVDEQLYTRTSAQSGPERRPTLEEEMALLEARRMVNQIGAITAPLRSASSLPDEPVTIDGHGIDCSVVRFTLDDMKSILSPDTKLTQTIWIDKARQVIVKILRRSETIKLLPRGAQRPTVVESTTIYPVVELDEKQPDSAFVFTPPAEAKLVESFPERRPHAATKESANFVGKPAPDVSLHGADGKAIGLSSFRGKPVFLEFWAAWCAPCTALTPELKKLYDETAPKGLVWVGIDSDQTPETATKYVATEHVSWPDYHDDNGAIGDVFGRRGIPLGVLVDRDGVVKFYGVGFGIEDLRAAIAKLGPEFASIQTATAK
jgi:thiol-disulfide isomerase/thioredoxin